MTKILYVGRNPEILEIVVRLINAKDEWLGIGAATDSEAISLFSQHGFALVLLGCGIERESEDSLVKLFKVMRSNVPVIQHYGGGSGLLLSEIRSALAQ